MREINIMQWNSEGIHSNKSEFLNLLRYYKIDIGLLQETFLRKKCNFYLPNFNIIRKDRQERSNYNPHGGVAIVIHKKHKYKEITINNPNDNCEAVAIVVKINNIEILFISIYCKPRHKTSKNQWNTFMQQFHNYPFILCGDFNSSHPLWGQDNYHDPEGYELEEFISQNNLCIANDDSFTRRPIDGWRDTVIDLTIVSPELGLLFDSWKVTKDPVNSKHYPIVMSITENTNILQNQEIKCVRNYKKADWNLFKKLSEINYHNFIISNNSILEKYQSLLEHINVAINKSIPVIKINPNNKNYRKETWWDTECNKKVAERRLALNRFNKDSTITNLIEYKRKKASTKKHLNQKRKSAWFKYCESLNPNVNLSEVYDKIKNLSGKNKSQQRPYNVN